MSTERVELRASGMFDVGARMDDLLESARKEVLRCEGASLGLLQATKSVNDLVAHVDRDAEEGKYDLEVAKHVKLYLSRAAQCVANLGMNAKNQQMMAAGQVQMAELAVTVTKKMFESEMQKKAAVAAAEASPDEVDPRSRMVGVRPATSIKEQRNAEEAPMATALVHDSKLARRGQKGRNGAHHT